MFRVLGIYNFDFSLEHSRKCLDEEGLEGQRIHDKSTYKHVSNSMGSTELTSQNQIMLNHVNLNQ